MFTPGYIGNWDNMSGCGVSCARRWAVRLPRSFLSAMTPSWSSTASLAICPWTSRSWANSIRPSKPIVYGSLLPHDSCPDHSARLQAGRSWSKSWDVEHWRKLVGRTAA